MADKPTLSPASREALMACFATKGKRKGRLLASAPKGCMGLPYIAWHAAMMSCNPYKVSIGALMMANAEQRVVWREVNDYFDARPALAKVCDLDRAILEDLGVW
jgi:hypothetical protein